MTLGKIMDIRRNASGDISVFWNRLEGRLNLKTCPIRLPGQYRSIKPLGKGASGIHTSQEYDEQRDFRQQKKWGAACLE